MSFRALCAGRGRERRGGKKRNPGEQRAISVIQRKAAVEAPKSTIGSGA